MTLAQLLVKIGVDPAGLSTGLSGAERTIERFASRATSVGAALTAGLTGPIIAVAGAAFAMANSVDDAMDEIRASTGATGSALEGLGRDFEAVAKRVPTSLDDAATAIGELNKRTDATGPALQDLAAQELNLARLTRGDLVPQIASTTRVFGDWGIATGRQSAALDFLWKTSQATGAGVSSLAEKVVQFGAPLRQLGFSFEQSVALLGKFEKEGVNTELVLGSLRIGLAKFANAGVDAPAALQAVIKRMQELGPGTQATALAMKIFGTRAGPDMAAAITEGRLAIDELVQRISAAPETISGAAAATDGWRESLVKLRNRAVLAFGALASPVLPVVTRWAEHAVDVFSGFAAWLERMSPTTRSWVIALATAAAAIGPLLVVVGSLTRAVLALRAAWVAFEITAGPIGWIALVVGALGALALGFHAVGKAASDAAARAAQAAIDFQAALGKMGPEALGTGIEQRARKMMELTEQSAGVRRQIADTESRIRRLGGDPNQSGTSLRNLLRPVQDLTGRLAGLRERLKDVENQWSATRDELRQMGDLLNPQTPSVPTPPTGPDVDLSRIGSSPAAAAGVDQLSGKLDTLRRRLDGVGKAARDAFAPLPGLVGSLTTLSGREIVVPNLGAEVGQLSTRLQAAMAGPTDAFKGLSATKDTGPSKEGGQKDGFLGQLGEGVSGLLAQFGPMSLALAAVNAVLAPLQPLIDALLVPFTIMGEIIAALLIPVMRVLFLPLKLLGIQVSLIGEVIARVAGAISGAIGWLVRGIGRLVNKLPGSPGDPLVKAGQAMIDLGHQFKDAAREMAAKRKELQELSFDDALNRSSQAVDRLTESVLNAVDGFKAARFRFAATDAQQVSRTATGSLVAGASSAPSSTSQTSQAPTLVVQLPPGAIIVNGAGDPQSVAQHVIAAFKTLALSNPDMRAWTATLPSPGFAV